ncbi:MAG TPA: hypothetical protein VJS92_02680 [Candidatus Polarisedimenticolaceae bacterium]|nr:hypothetical protein [Candidatus Polarisedimenticolaceae bacterium]
MPTASAVKSFLTPVLVACALMALYGFHGYNAADDGFIMGLAYRIYLGQLPHADFIYIRPPGSVLLHAAVIGLTPWKYQVLFERFLFYLSLAASGQLSVAILDRGFGLRTMGLRAPLLTALFTTFSVQSFPPMPWHTVDAVLLAVIGVYFVANVAEAWGGVAAALAFLLSASCKQSFLPLSVGALVYLWAVRSRRDALRFALASAGFAFGLLAVAWRWGILGPLLRQSAGAATPASLVHSGLIAYFAGYWVLVVAGLLLWVVADRFSAWTRGTRVHRAWLPYGLVTAVLLGAALHFLLKQRFEPPWLNYPAFFFLVTVAALVHGRLGTKTASATLALMMAVSWCASLGWGYQTPVLYSAPFLFGSLLLAQRYFGTPPRSLAAFTLALSAALQLVAYQFPYMELKRSVLDHHLGEVFDRLTGVWSSRSNYERHAELRALHEEFGDRYAVLPAMPLAHYLTGTTPVLPVDWARNSEYGYDTDRLVQVLDSERPVVFVDRTSGSLCRGGPSCSDISMYVLEHWKKLRSNAFFDVYVYPVVTSPPG